MPSLVFEDFELVACQAVIYTPEEQFSTGRVMREFYPQWTDLFDADPVVLPSFPGVPSELSRFVLQDQSTAWRCEIAPAKLSILWQRLDFDKKAVDREDFFEQSVKIFSHYHNVTGSRIGRLAAVLTRFVRQDKPGLALARHFCQDKWDKAPLDRPENFELHAHKRFQMARQFSVNSWARSKSGYLKTTEKPAKAVVFEQDINTLAEEATSLGFTVEQLSNFYILVQSEFDHIVKLYYPKMVEHDPCKE